MNVGPKLCLQVTGFGVVGAIPAYFFGTKMPTEIASEMLQTLGNISIIAGSLVAWSGSWISQSRGLVRDIDYDAAANLFHKLGNSQKELIWRWLIVFGCSIVPLFCAAIMKTPELDAEFRRWLFIASSGFLTIAIVFVLYLFQRMLALANLKTKLDEFERSELRKIRLLPNTKEGE